MEINDSFPKREIKLNEKYVCIHNRDSTYLKHKYPSINWKYHNFRDFHINDMNKLINNLLKKNYNVVRLGELASDKISIKDDRIIDYPFINKKTDINEYDLINNCEFYIGSNAGIWMYPMYLKKKMLIVNWHQYSLLNKLKHNNFSIIPKLYFDENKNRYLKLDEICSRSLDELSQSSQFINNKIKLVNNTNQDILESSIEFDVVYKVNKNEDLINEFWLILNKYNKYYSNNRINVKVSGVFLKKYEKLLF